MERVGSFLNNNRHFLLLLFFFILSEILVRPTGEYPLNDDWSYTKSVLILTREGHVDIGAWPAMSLLTHILWGGLFVKLFGFSFFILRVSTLVAAFTGIYFLYRLVSRVGGNPGMGLLAALTLMFNPLHFNLSNTFMTDVGFNTLLILSVYVAVVFIEAPRWYHLLLIFLLSCALVLLRQFGLIVPLCFTFACLFLNNRKLLWFSVSAACTLLVYLIFRYYEEYLRGILPPEASYKFSGALHSGGTSPVTVRDHFLIRWQTMVLSLSLYTLPLVVLLLIQVASKLKKHLLALAFVAAAMCTVLFFGDVTVLPGNVFVNMSLGAETWYQSLIAPATTLPHTHSEAFEWILQFFKYISLSLMFTLLISLLILRMKGEKYSRRLPAFPVFIISLLCAYLAVLLITESYFDRYHLPAITLGIIPLSMAGTRIPASRTVSVAVVVLFAYISIAGTHDYLLLNRKKWEAYRYLIEEKNIAPETVNAGFEVNCWNNGKPGWWANILTLEPYRYLIQYKAESGFRHVRTFGFQRYFPYKKDQISIFEKSTTD